MGRDLTLNEARRYLDRLHHTKLNYDLTRTEEFTPENGWYVDDYCVDLGSESPGPPEPGGIWETAVRLVKDYEFADPSIVRAFYYASEPLAGRTMLLEAKFYGLTFHLGVRVAGIVDEIREQEGRKARVWGWSYRTLQGHLEKGQMTYEVLKWLDSGAVRFRTHAYSKTAHITSPMVRLGFALFGRSMQKKFVRLASSRMQGLTNAAVDRNVLGSIPSPLPLPLARRRSIRPADNRAIS